MSIRTKTEQILKHPGFISSLAIAILACLPAGVHAQGTTGSNSAARWGMSEFYIGGAFLGGGSTILEGAPVKLDFEDDWGLTLGGGYHLNNHLFVGGELLFANSAFTGTSEDDDSVLRQSMRQWGITGGFEYNFLEGPFTPYISAGLGFTYLETDDPSRDPEYVCVPDYYWGWWCYWATPVYSDWVFTYYAGVGLRWDVNDRSVLRLSYKSNWIDAANIPRQEVIALTWGGKF